MKNIFTSLPFILLVSVVFGLLLGLVVNEPVMAVINTFSDILRQLIMFCVPLIILGFIAPSIARLGSNVTRMLGVAVFIAYISSVGAALFSMIAGYGIIPNLTIPDTANNLRELPEIIFPLEIPQIMSVMSALVLALMIGLSAVWAKAERFTEILEEFQRMVLTLVTKIIIPLLPFFILCTFCGLSYEGLITQQLPVFLIVILIVIAGQFIWLAVLYSIAGAYSRSNPLDVIKHYGPAYLTAIGTMSSAATLGVALECAGEAKPLRRDMVGFGIPLFANIHLCGSVLTEVFFCMVVSLVLYGTLPDPGTMILFCFLLGVFAIGAPGVPGGTVMASLGLVTSVLGFDGAGTALVLTVFALQDSFGTACNVTGDGALTLILTGYANKHGVEDSLPDIEFFNEEMDEADNLLAAKPVEEGSVAIGPSGAGNVGLPEEVPLGSQGLEVPETFAGEPEEERHR